MKKSFIWVLILSMLVSVSCVAGGGSSDTSDAADTAPTGTSGDTEAVTEFRAFGTVEPGDFDGYTFRILYPSNGESYNDFHAPDINGSVLNDAIYMRNLQVSEHLGIKMEIEWETTAKITDRIRNLVSTGSYDYDMYGGHRSTLPLGYGGYLYNYHDMEAINLEGEWWDQNWVESMSVVDSLYTLVGDISVKMLLFTSAICFNKQLFEDNNLGEPYDLVREKKWTYDALYSLISGYSSDLNSDGKLDWETDRFGLVGWGSEAGFSLFYGSGVTFISKTDDGKYEFNYNSDRLISIIDKVYDVWVTANSYFNNSGSTAQHHQPFTAFVEDRALFCDLVLYKVSMFLLDMKSDYGIIPQPMYDENQEDYYTYTGYTIPLIMVPANCPVPEQTGRIIEAYCAASYDEVTPDLFSIVTEVKNARDADTSEMIRIIIRNKFFDPAHWYNISGYGGISRSVIANKNNNVASILKSYERPAQNSLNQILDAYEKLSNP